MSSYRCTMIRELVCQQAQRPDAGSVAQQG